jgi:hypothetical protein
VAALLPAARYRETYFSYFGPLSLIVLIGLWAIMLVAGFAMLQLAAGSAVNAPSADFWTDLYLSGTTFFTLGLGDVAPVSSLARALTVIESGMGFGFLALVIGYLPALNQSFSRREGEDADRMLNELRGMYEPYVHSFSRRLLMSIPPWIPEAAWSDNWQTSAWRLPSGPRKSRTPGKDDNRHF